jgi:hypothetical protein
MQSALAVVVAVGPQHKQVAAVVQVHFLLVGLMQQILAL